MKKQRKQYGPEEKVAILRRHLLEKEPISKLFDEMGLQLHGIVRPSLSFAMAQHAPVPMTMTAGKFTCCPSSYCPMA